MDTDRRPTISDIAAAASVSIPTVSKVLNGKLGVAQTTRDRVQRVITDLGYISNSAARTLRRGQTGIVDLVLLGLDSDYVVEILRGVEEALDRAGLRLALTVTHDASRRERRWLVQVADRVTDGAILVLAEGQSERLEALRRYGVPYVVIDHRGGLGPDVPSVGATNVTGGRQATEYLLALGHRRIAIVNGPPSIGCSQERLAGYRWAHEAAGEPINPEYVRTGTFFPEAGYEQGRALLALPEPPTAIFAGNDMQAYGVYGALRARGLTVGKDVSVVGFDDLPMSRLANPPLTTVLQPLADMGRTATSMLLRLLNGEPLDSTRVELPTKLVVRESCSHFE